MLHDKNGWKKATRENELEQARQITPSLYVNSKLQSIQCCCAWKSIQRGLCVCVSIDLRRRLLLRKTFYFDMKPSSFTLDFALFVSLRLKCCCFLWFCAPSNLLAFEIFPSIAINRIAGRLQISRALRSFLGFFGCIRSPMYENL